MPKEGNAFRVRKGDGDLQKAVELYEEALLVHYLYCAAHGGIESLSA